MIIDNEFKSQAARDARDRNYGDQSYWSYLEKSCIEHAEYYEKRGLKELANKMMTQSLGESLQGNDGI